MADAFFSGVLFFGLGIFIALFWNVALKRKVMAKTAELKESYEALQKGEERFRDFFENAGEGIFLVDNSWMIVDANSAAIEMLGYSSRNDFLGLTGYDLLHPGDIDKMSPTEVVEKLREDETFRIERRFRRSDGTYLPVFVSIKFIRGKELHHILFRDISEQKLAERIKSARLHLIEHAPQLSTGELLQKIIDEAEALTESNIGFYHFLENDENSVSLQAWSSNTIERKCFVELPAQHYPVEHAGVWADTIHERKPLICNDYDGLAGKKGLPKGHAALVRYLSVPVFRGGKIVAVLGVGNKKTDYVANDTDMVQQLADLAWEIIEKSRAEEELRKSEEIFSNVFHNAPLLMSLSRIEDGRYYDVNDAFVKATGYSRERIIGATSLELEILDGDSRQMLKEKLLKTGRVRGVELALKKADGATMICEYSGIVLSIGGRQLLLSIASDTTYRRQMENELVIQAENLNTLFNAIPSVLILLDEQGRVEKINAEGSGYSRNEEDDFRGQLAGNSLRCIHSAGEEGCGSTLNCRNCPVHDCFTRTLESGEPCVDVEGELTSGISGKAVSRNVLISSRLLVIRGEKKILLAINDITSLKETEKIRHDLEVQLNQAQKLESIGRLAGGVAHDMNNLLAPIIGYGEMLVEDISTADPRRDSAEQIVAAANKATVLIRQLLAFSRKQSLEFKPLNLNVLLRNFEKLIRRTLREDILITITLAPELPEIEGDAGQLEQVIMNLAVNAQDAMPEGGKLEFITALTNVDDAGEEFAESQLRGKCATLIVRDSGVGIAKEIVDHIFEPFFTTKEQDKGTGLGLASVYGIVRQHRGDIVVSSKAQEGTTFKMYFPVAQVQEKSEELPESTSNPQEGYGTILVVEDDDGLRNMVVTILKRKGYTPLAAANGEEALALMADTEVSIDLLLTDVVMPNMSGRKLALKIAKEYGEIKTLYMSGYNDEIMEYQDLDSTKERFIEKPFSMNTLVEKVQEMLV